MCISEPDGFITKTKRGLRFPLVVSEQSYHAGFLEVMQQQYLANSLLVFDISCVVSSPKKLGLILH